MSVSECGEINKDSVYTLAEFQNRTGLKRHALRTARRQGLKVNYLHSRGFILGKDWLSYLDQQAANSK